MADELTLKEALLDIVGGLKDPKQWQDTYEGLRRTRDAIPGVAESYIRGGLSQVAGQYGDLRDLATATSEFIPEKLRKVTSIAQFLSNPYLQTAINRAPTSEQVLEATPRITPEHEGAKDVEMMGGWTAPGGAGVAKDVLLPAAKAYGKFVGPTAYKAVEDYMVKTGGIQQMMTGPESKLWKPELEFAARKLEAKKASPEQIRDATGLVRGLDKEWRTELGDEFSKMKDTESGGRSVSFGELAANQNPVNLQYPVFFDRKAKEIYGTGMPDTNKMTPDEFEKFKKWRIGVVNEYEALRKKGLTLGDVFKHDDLLKAYPEVADIRVEASGSPHFNGAFSIENGKPVIKINESLNLEQARSTMLHELQHYIQRKEGWATGGSTASYRQQDDARIAQSALSVRQEAERMDNSIPFEQRVEQASDMLNRLTSSDKFGGDVKKIALDTVTNPTNELENMNLLYGTDKNILPHTPREMYRLIGGEAEARLIQARRDMTAEERAKSFPFEYQAPQYQNMELMPNYKLDIKPEQAIIHGREPGVIEVGGKRISGEPVPGAEGQLSSEGRTYDTRQEGPYYRVSRANIGSRVEGGSGTSGNAGGSARPNAGTGTGTSGQTTSFPPDDEVGRIIADPERNEPLKLAQQYVKENFGKDFQKLDMPPSSLAKQSAIGRVHLAAVEGSPEYKNAVFDAYKREMPDLIKETGATDYEDLMAKAYKQLAIETDKQFKSLPYDFSFHRNGEGNYANSMKMAGDVHGNKHLYVFQGGDRHDYLHNVDQETGLNENEKFRAVHDLYGHAIYGNQFGPKGEEIAWGIHQQMYSPLARLAMTAETRGQNSVVNYTPLNARLKELVAKYESHALEAVRRGDMKAFEKAQEAKREAFLGFEFAPQKAVLLPPEFLDPQYKGGMPKYLQGVISPKPETTLEAPLTHFSNEPNLETLDPAKYGRGIKGAEAKRLTELPGAVRERAYAYIGKPEEVMPEPGLGPHKYEAKGTKLYDIAKDPLGFKVLAAEANRTPFSAGYNKGLRNKEQELNDIERLAMEYGYEGFANTEAGKPMAILFNPTVVKPKKR